MRSLSYLMCTLSMISNKRTFHRHTDTPASRSLLTNREEDAPAVSVLSDTACHLSSPPPSQWTLIYVMQHVLSRGRR